MSLNDVFYELGKMNASELRKEAANLTGTQIIDREYAVPQFDPDKDYADWPIGSPVVDEDQVWLLLIPHNAQSYPDLRPSDNRACWGLAHTKNPAKAKAWVDAYGTSGMYMTDECYKDEDGLIWRASQDNLIYDATALPDAWTQVVE